MDTTKAQQIAWDDALVAPANRFKIRKCNHRLSSDLKSNKHYIQVVLDALKLTPFYNAFHITANVPEIYMHEFWATVSTYNHSLRDDPMFNTIWDISRHLETQVYGAILPAALTNQEMLDSKAYKEYYAVAYGAEPPKSKTKYKKRAAESVTSPKSKTTSASKDEGTSTILGVPDIPPYESKSDRETWGDSKDEYDDDDDDDRENDDDDESNDHDDASDNERTESNSDDIHDLNLTNVDQTEYEEKEVDEGTRTPSDDELIDEEKLNDEEDDEVFKELYEDVNVNLKKGDAEMTDANQGGSKQHNVSQESGFEQEGEDAHVTLTPVSDAQKADEPIQSYSVSSDFTSKFLNLENPSPSNNEIASLMENSAPHATAIPELTSGFITTTPPPPSVSALETKMSELRQTNQFTEAVSLILGIVDKYRASKMKEAVNVDSTMKKIIKDQVKEQVSKMMPKMNKYVIETLGAEVLVRTTNQPQTDTQKNLCNALVESYNSDKDIITSYGDVVLLKRGRDDQDKDEDLYAGLGRGMKRRKSGKDAESSIFKRSQVTLLKNQACKKIKSSALGTTMNNLLTRRLPKLTVTRLTIMKKYDYGLLEETEVRRDDQELYTFKEGDFKRLRLQDIEDISNLRNKTAYTSHSDPHGIIYVDSFKRKRLMRTDVLYKFSDETLNDVRTALHDIVAGLRMDYLPMRRWSNLDKKMASVMLQDIDKQLYQRMLMRNLEKFVGGRPYGENQRLMERTI
nr:hypothetical protein [Tanacetum cinerariifolium]